jgi:hypothetical protein
MAPVTPNVAGHRDDDWRSSHDPSALTTERLAHEICTLKELLEAKIRCLQEELCECNEDLRALRAEMTKEVEAKIQFLKELHQTTIASLKELHNAAIHDTQQNATILTGVIQTAINKSEASYTKQFDAVNMNISAQNQANTERINDIKERMDRNEGESGGKKETVTNTRVNMNLMMILIGTVIAFFAMAIGGVALFISLYHKV